MINSHKAVGYGVVEFKADICLPAPHRVFCAVLRGDASR